MEIIKFKGTICQIRHRKPEGWASFVVNSMGNYRSCTGILSDMVGEDSDVTCEGVEELSDKFGLQVKCTKVFPAPVSVDTREGVIRLLQQLKGIGESKALIAVDKYGAEKAWEIAQENPCLLGVSEDDREKMIEKAVKMVPTINATIYLLSIGLTDNKTKKVIEHFGRETENIVQNNPYKLIEIEGFGFKTTDAIALKAGVSAGNSSRVNACILACLNDSQINQGNVFMMGYDLVGLVQSELQESAIKAMVSLTGMPEVEDVRSMVYGLAKDGLVVIHESRVFSKALLNAEKTIHGMIFNSDPCIDDEVF